MGPEVPGVVKDRVYLTLRDNLGIIVKPAPFYGNPEMDIPRSSTDILAHFLAATTSMLFTFRVIEIRSMPVAFCCLGKPKTDLHRPEPFQSNFRFSGLIGVYKM